MGVKFKQSQIDDIIKLLPVYGGSITSKLLGIPYITAHKYAKRYDIELPTKLEVEDFIIENLKEELKKLA